MSSNKHRGELSIGAPLPAFTLLNQQGSIVSSSNLISKPLVIFFYPKDDTPVCVAEACSFRNHFEDFRQLDATVIGISADTPASHAVFAKKYRLPFDLLSDQKDVVRKKFGVPSPFLGMAPGRVTYIFDDNGKLAYKFNAFFQAKAHVETALKQLKQLKKVG